MKKFLIFCLFILRSLAIDSETDLDTQLFTYMNAERDREHLDRLSWDKTVYEVALAHSKEMAKMDKLTHKGSDGSEPHERIRDAGIYASKTAENIAGDINIISAHTGLMKSLYHRENILDPDFTHAAAAVYQQDGYLFITELFIRKIGNYSVEDARKLILNQINRFRKEHDLPPLSMSKSLCDVAQSHVEVQSNLGTLSPLLIMSVLTKQLKDSLLVNVYTTTSLFAIPAEAQESLQMDLQMVGVGFKRAKGGLCEGGCYVVALLLAKTGSAG